jgi:hydroxymethylglutaryl-CoA lyase
MRAADGRRIYIQEVSPRDGFQIEPRFIPTARKIDYIERLSRTGLAKIEFTSFVSPAAVPSLSDAAQVATSLRRVPGVEYSALVPNLRGCERALAVRVDDVNLVMSASESHNRANLRMSCEQSLEQFKAIVQRVGSEAAVSVSVSTAFGCPFEGDISSRRILGLVSSIVDLGIRRISLCDTTGIANPAQVQALFRAVIAEFPLLQLTAHFHNTRGMGLANVIAAIEAGVNRFDASLGGLGGCPFAPGATGNVCTEDLVHMLQMMGYATGIDLNALLVVAQDLETLVGHPVPGQLVKAGVSTRRYPLPASPPDGSPRLQPPALSMDCR